MLWAALISVQVASAAPFVVFDIDGLGLSENDRSTLSAAALADAQGQDQSARPGPRVSAPCRADPVCVKDALQGGKRGVYLYAVRVGPYFEIDTSLFGPDGVRLDKRRIDWSPDSGTPLLPALWLSAEEPQPAPAPAEPPVQTTPPPGPAEPEANAQAGKEDVAPDPATADGPGALGWSLVGVGGVAVAVGALSFIAGATFALIENNVLADPQSPGTAKERARVTGFIGLGAAVGSAALMAAGVAILVSGVVLSE